MWNLINKEWNDKLFCNKIYIRDCIDFNEALKKCGNRLSGYKLYKILKYKLHKKESSEDLYDLFYNNLDLCAEILRKDIILLIDDNNNFYNIKYSIPLKYDKVIILLTQKRDDKNLYYSVGIRNETVIKTIFCNNKNKYKKLFKYLRDPELLYEKHLTEILNKYKTLNEIIINLENKIKCKLDDEQIKKILIKVHKKNEIKL